MSDTWARTDSTTDSNIHGLAYRFTNGINGVPNQFTMYASPDEDRVARQGGARRLRAGSLDDSTATPSTWAFATTISAADIPDQYRGPVPFLPNQNYSSAAVTTMSCTTSRRAWACRTTFRQRQDGRQGHVGQVRPGASSPSAIRWA